jgi:hypothetical protein
MLPVKELFSDEFRLIEIIIKKKKKTCQISPESLLRAFWEKKIKSA